MVQSSLYGFSLFRLNSFLYVSQIIYEPGPWICRSMRGQDGKRNSKAYLRLWFVLKCRSARSRRDPMSISFNRKVSEPHTSQHEVYVHFDRADAIESSPPVLNIHITSTFVSALRIPDSQAAMLLHGVRMLIASR